MRNIGIVRVNGKYILEHDAAILDYVERGISTEESISLRKKPGKKEEEEPVEVTKAPERENKKRSL